jgi:hypothetical protein
VGEVVRCWRWAHADRLDVEVESAEHEADAVRHQRVGGVAVEDDEVDVVGRGWRVEVGQGADVGCSAWA